MLKSTTISRLKKSGNSYYLGKPKYTKIYHEKWKSKVNSIGKSNKTKWKHKDLYSEHDAFQTKKTYILYDR